MNRLVDQIADAVLYEGYILYPYRPSVKNRQRWTFGGLYPRSYSEAQGGSDAWNMQTECLVQGGPDATLDVRVRFLHLLARTVGEVDCPSPPQPPSPTEGGGGSKTDSLPSPLCGGGVGGGGEPPFRPVETLQIGDRLLQTWQEAVEREVNLGGLVLNELIARPRQKEFGFPASRQWEPVCEPTGPVAGILVREQQAIAGTVEVVAERIEEGLFKVAVRIMNRTPLEDAGDRSRDDALMHSLVSTHTIVGVQDGEFVSLLDPGERWRAAAAGCRNVGTWPVLVGEEGQKDTVLSSPIILYDYPRIAPESAGDLFDGTEIDEILTLRILTLTDEEKREMVAVDDRARALLDRTESLAREQLMKLHGTMRDVQPLRERES